MISIFKTSVDSHEDLTRLKPSLNFLSDDLKWTIDLYDADRILRVVSTVDRNSEVISVLNDLGFHCENMATFYSAP